jgi:hypothetical protein
VSDEQQPTEDRTRLVRREEPVRYSRRPRMVPFLATGAVLGLLAGIALMVLGPESDSSGAGQELVLLGSTGALLGGLVGAIVFLAVERRHR